jgi:hypothetical protein
MPIYQLLTDRTLAQASAITPTTLIHIVTTGDTSQNPAGSSYKAELGQLAGLFSGTSDTLVTGGTYSAGTITFTNNSGGTFNVSGLTEPFTGGTVSGATNFTNGLTANTITVISGLTATTVSATTYENVNAVTGGTYNSGTGVITTWYIANTFACKSPKSIEILVHQQLKQYNVNKEGFGVTLPHAENVIKQIIIDSNASLSIDNSSN